MSSITALVDGAGRGEPRDAGRRAEPSAAARLEGLARLKRCGVQAGSPRDEADAAVSLDVIHWITMAEKRTGMQHDHGSATKRLFGSGVSVLTIAITTHEAHLVQAG